MLNGWSIATAEPRSPRLGPAAQDITALWWLFFVLGAAVFVLVVVLLVAPMVRRRRGGEHREPADHSEVPSSVANRWIVGFGLILPLILLAAALTTSVATMRALPQAAPDGLVIEVVGHQWWWSAHYPDPRINVANEIHIPVGEPVELRLTSADVIHSFWIPNLHGKLDALPDGTNTLVLQADEPGVYGGECAEFCGLQHANMGVLIIAEPADDFAAWLAEQEQPAAAPVSAAAQRGQVVYQRERCANCHTIFEATRTGTAGDGPDLTHVASRSTLASDTITNTTANLTAFLRDPGSVKDGIQMPTPQLTDDELRDLVAYVEELE